MAKDKDNELYYIQTGYVGNAILWWAINSKGYTTDLARAGKYTKEEAERITERPQDVAWLCEHVDNNLDAKKVIVEREHLDDNYRIVGKLE